MVVGGEGARGRSVVGIQGVRCWGLEVQEPEIGGGWGGVAEKPFTAKSSAVLPPRQWPCHAMPAVGPRLARGGCCPLLFPPSLTALCGTLQRSACAVQGAAAAPLADWIQLENGEGGAASHSCSLCEHGPPLTRAMQMCGLGLPCA